MYVAEMKSWPAFKAINVLYFASGKLLARSGLGTNGVALGTAFELECWAHEGAK